MLLERSKYFDTVKHFWVWHGKGWLRKKMEFSKMIYASIKYDFSLYLYKYRISMKIPNRIKEFILKEGLSSSL